MTDLTMTNSPREEKLIIPALGPFYSGLGEAVTTLLRVVAGVALVVHGASKITDPFGTVGMVEGLGFYPGVLWSPLLAATEFFGGLLIAIGLLTRPASFAAMIVLLVTVWFHWITLGQGYSGAEKSILWAAIFAFFTVRGGGRWSVDAKLGRAF
ncbi:MAG: DoxX family protein [Mesorhizobium sp.]